MMYIFGACHSQTAVLFHSRGNCKFAKRLLCELQTVEEPGWDEVLIRDAVPHEIDYASPTLQLELAAALGKNNPQQCGVVYNR